MGKVKIDQELVNRIRKRMKAALIIGVMMFVPNSYFFVESIYKGLEAVPELKWLAVINSCISLIGVYFSIKLIKIGLELYLLLRSADENLG